MGAEDKRPVVRFDRPRTAYLLRRDYFLALSAVVSAFFSSFLSALSRVSERRCASLKWRYGKFTSYISLKLFLRNIMRIFSHHAAYLLALFVGMQTSANAQVAAIGTVYAPPVCSEGLALRGGVTVAKPGTPPNNQVMYEYINSHPVCVVWNS